MGYVWTKFGQLVDSDDSDGRYLYIINDSGERRKISLVTYAPSIPKIKEKINLLKGENIQIRTSQNTEDWSSDVWFSDLSIANTEVKDSGGKISDETIIELKQKLEQERELRIKASERAESYQEKYNEVSDKNIALEEKYIALEEEFDELSKTDQKVVVEQGKELDKLNILGKKFDFQIKGHPLKSFALRQGIAHTSKGRLQLKIVKKIKRNLYEVELPMYNNQRIPMALGIDNQTFFIKTVEWSSINERSKLKELGYNEIELKSGDYPLEELVNIHKEVVSNL